MKVTLVYLAAGNGRRFENSIYPWERFHCKDDGCLGEEHIFESRGYSRKGWNHDRYGAPLQSNKLLFPIEGQPMYLHLLKRLARICERHRSWEVVVVTRYQEIMEGAERLGVRAVFSPESYRGVSWSVKAGLMVAEEGESEACAFFVADQPFLTEETAEAFLMAMEGSREQENCEGERGRKETREKKNSEKGSCEKESPGNSLGCVSCQGMTGNPVWFSRKFFPELLKLEEDQGGKRVLKAHWEEAQFFSVADPEELQDIDVWISEKKLNERSF